VIAEVGLKRSSHNSLINPMFSSLMGGEIELTSDVDDYTEYLKRVSTSRVTMLSLLSGFTFSAITLLIFSLPDPTGLTSQITLFFLVLLFDLCLLLLAWQTIIVIGTWDVRNAPPHAIWELSVFNLLLIVVFVLWGWSVVLMFLVNDLDNLAFISGVLWVSVIIIVIAVLRLVVKRLGWSVRKEFKNIKLR